MKKIYQLYFFLISLSVCNVSLQAQYETTAYLYDTISQGPFLEKEKSGYNFLFMTQDWGGYKSNKAVISADQNSIKFNRFNHYHIRSNGQVDSLIAVPLKIDITQHYTLYERGMPKMIEFRIGSSNDPSIELVKEKYPIIRSNYNNDESLSQNIIKISGKGKEKDLPPYQYKYTNNIYNKGNIKSDKAKSSIEIESDHDNGSWIIANHVSTIHHDAPRTLITLGHKIEGEKALKYNHLTEYKFLTLDAKGNVVTEEDYEFDQAYRVESSGLVHNADGTTGGYFISFQEEGKKANDDYNAATKKVVYFDEEGQFMAEANLVLPFTPKSKEAHLTRVVSVYSGQGGYQIYVRREGNAKKKTPTTFYHFESDSEESVEVATYTMPDPVEGMRNVPAEAISASDRYDYAIGLDNGQTLIVASEHGTDINGIIVDNSGKIVSSIEAHMPNNIYDKEAELKMEKIGEGKILIVSKIPIGKGVKTSYAVYSSVGNQFRTIQPKEEISEFSSFRNGDDLIVYGPASADPTQIHIILEKIASESQILTFDE